MVIGGEVCRLIPALSLLKDGKMYGQLQRSFYENVCACFEVKEGAAGTSMHKEITQCHVQLPCFVVCSTSF